MTTARLIIDRIEGSTAVIVGPEGFAIDIPRAWLPDHVSEGDAVSLAPSEDKAARRDAEARRTRLAARDPGGDIDL